MYKLTISKLHELYLEEGDSYILNCIYYQTIKLGYVVKKKIQAKNVIMYLTNDDIESICGYVLTRALSSYDGTSAKFMTYLYAGIYNKVVNDNKKMDTYNRHNFLDYDDSLKDMIYSDSNNIVNNVLNDVIESNVVSKGTKDIMKLIATGCDMTQTGNILGKTKQAVNQALKREKNNKELYYNLKFN